MSRTALAASLMLFGMAVLPQGASPKPANVPAAVTFDDLVGPADARVRSDVGLPYVDGEDCVQSWYATPKGNFFFRTVRSSPPECRVAQRSVVLDFSDRSWPGACPHGGVEVTDRAGNVLQACGVNSVADVRLVADRLFSASATKLDVPFSLVPDFQNTAFELDFLESLAVTGSGARRTMTAAPNALADLYQLDGRTKTLVGRYRMPLQVTVEAY